MRNKMMEILILCNELKDSIKTDFSAFEKALYSYDYNSKKYGYRSSVDINSFADYLILNEFTVNYDAGSYSTYIYKDINGKFKMCVWDFNNACDNYQEGSWMTVQHFSLHNKPWFVMMMRDDYFTERVIKRYKELRKTYLSEEYLLNYIDDVVEYLGPAIDRNFERWGYTFDEDYEMLSPHDRDIHSYDDAINQLKSFIVSRGTWMDENIESLRQYSAESKVKKYNEVTD